MVLLGLFWHFFQIGLANMADDFSEKIDGRKVNRGAVQNLIAVGALDWTGQPRSLMWERIEQQKKSKKKEWPSEVTQWSQLQSAKKEMDALGFSLRGDAYGFVTEWLQDANAKPFKELKGRKGKKNMTGGLITNITKYQSKNGEMAFIDLEDGDDGGVMNVWAESWEGYKKQLEIGHFVIVVGKILEKGKIGIDSTCAISIKAKVDA